MFACLYAPGNLPILLNCALEFSPLVEVTSADAVTADLQGLTALLGRPEQIACAIDVRIGVPASIAVASNPDTAFYAAKGRSGVTVIAPGQESTVLAALGINLLECPTEIGLVFDMWGIRTFGDLATLPAAGIAARLGEAGVHLQQLARGAVQRQLRLFCGPKEFRRCLDLEEPIISLEPLCFLLSNMLGELCQELGSQSLATNGMHLQLQLEDDSSHEVLLRLPVPMLDRRALLKLLQLHLDENPLRAPITHIQLSVEHTRPQTIQHDLFAPAYPLPGKTEVTIRRIQHFVGTGNIGTPEVIDTHRPDSFLIHPFTPMLKAAPVERNGGARLALRRFRPPDPAQVRLVQQRPTYISSARVRGDIVQAQGPWPTSGNWWRSDAWKRKEWDVALRTGAVYRIFEDVCRMAWFVDGNYD
jgi:protein ImuB